MKISGEPAGAFLVRVIPLVVVLMAGLRLAHQPLHIAIDRFPTLWYGPGPLGLPRTAVESAMQAEPGKELVIVRYSSKHDCLDEWVYNAADIDRAKVVWAREMGPQRDHELLEYYKDRSAWLVEPDKVPPAVTHYTGKF
jgi:hypothetical protein